MNLSSNQVLDKFKMVSKYKGWENNVWIEFGALANKNKACNMGQGFPDFKILPDSMLNAFKDPNIMDNPMIHQYTRGFGHIRLVNALAKLYSSKLDHELDPLNNILVTVGAYGSLYFVIDGLISQNDEVIIIEPFFDCYQPMVEIAGGKCVFIPLRPVTLSKDVKLSSSHWKLDFEEMESKINKNTKAIILNTPNNPLGKVYSREELEKIATLCKKYNILVISDEVYEWLVYKPSTHISIASLPGMWERTLTIGSIGKTFNATGFKVGWTIGPDNLLNSARVGSQNSLSTCPTLMQEIGAVGFETEIPLLNKPESYFSKVMTMLIDKRTRICDILNKIEMQAYIPEGGYFIVADYRKFIGLANEKDSTKSIVDGDGNTSCKDAQFSKWLCSERKLATIPCTAFYSKEHKHIGENYIRFCFMKKDETLNQTETILMGLKA